MDVVEEKVGEIKIVSDISLLGDCVDSNSINGIMEKHTRKFLDIFGVGGQCSREKEMKSALDMFGLICPRSNSYADV